MGGNNNDEDRLENPLKDFQFLELPAQEWSVSNVLTWLELKKESSNELVRCISEHRIDGKTLLELDDQDVRDIKYRLHYRLTVYEMKSILRAINEMRLRYGYLLADEDTKAEKMYGNTEIVSNCKFLESPTHQWSVAEIICWFKQKKDISEIFLRCLSDNRIDGKTLLDLTDQDIRDMRYRLDYRLTLYEMKRIMKYINELKTRNNLLRMENQQENRSYIRKNVSKFSFHQNDFFVTETTTPSQQRQFVEKKEIELHNNGETSVGKSKMQGSKCIPPDVFKTILSLAYSFVVTWITSFVMVIVHERVPDMKRYPPLPDIFLDNVPHIPWAFHMCEITGTLLFFIWTSVCIFHKYRLVLLRRFFALAGTVFLLRCVTMLITSLSVPGTHLQCNQKDYPVDETSKSFLDSLEVRISRAYSIWSGLGMSIQGVRTCGDYMFSGHTVALTLMNFFITEYTPRNLYFLHTLTWLLNMFGIFFILAAHEHYSIDVFVAFYITSRLFLYYHTLANNQALMSRDSNRTRIWFPMFSYFESSVEGIIPNEYDSLGSLFDFLIHCIVVIKNNLVVLLKTLWLESHKLVARNKNILNVAKNLNLETYSPANESDSIQSSDDRIANSAPGSNEQLNAEHKKTL